MDWTKKVFNFVLSFRNIIPFHARKHGSMYNFTYFHISCLHNSNPGLSLYISKHWIRTLHQPPYSQNLYKFSLHKLIITLSIAIYSQGPMLRKCRGEMHGCTFHHFAPLTDQWSAAPLPIDLIIKIENWWWLVYDFFFSSIFHLIS